MELIDPPHYQSSSSELTPIATEYMRRSASWMRFLAIIGFVIIGMLVIGSFEVGRHFSFGFMITSIYILFALFLFFPSYYLYQSANAIHQYIINRQPQLLERALIRQNQFWSYVGVIMVVYLIFIVLVVLIGGATFMSMSHFMHHGHHVINNSTNDPTT